MTPHSERDRACLSGTCPCQGSGLLFEHLFEYPQGVFVNRSGEEARAMSAEVVKPHEVVSDGGLTPIEFTFRGRRFRIHAVLSRWCEAGGWWNRISDGKFRPDDQARALWKVEAAPIGALTTFELERDEATGQWIIRAI